MYRTRSTPSNRFLAKGDIASRYVGVYDNQHFGRIFVTQSQDDLRLRTGYLEARIEANEGKTFRVEFANDMEAKGHFELRADRANTIVVHDIMGAKDVRFERVDRSR